MREIALHLLDIAENSVAACARDITIAVDEDARKDRLLMIVEDNGKGMDEDMVARVVDPFVTSRTTRKVGLGIPLLKAAAEGCNGYLHINSAVGRGTRLEVEFQRSHIDRMPLGDLIGTWFELLVAWPQIHWIFRYRASGGEFLFDDAPIKKELGDVSLSEPSILTYLRETLQEGVKSVQKSQEDIHASSQIA
ncbi:MAG: ATP-binding protein [Chloroflexi bacterium]|nr:ATP-binding protein [Chloroflexota bacterium]